MSVSTVRFPSDVTQALESLSHQLDRSKGWVINKAVADFIEKKQQEQERWEQTLQAMESAAKGKIVGSDQVHEWLSSWGTDQELQAPKPE